MYVVYMYHVYYMYVCIYVCMYNFHKIYKSQTQEAKILLLAFYGVDNLFCQSGFSVFIYYKSGQTEKKIHLHIFVVLEPLLVPNSFLVTGLWRV